MAARILVVANPPHGEFDPQRAAPQLGLTAADVAMKARYPIPEIWLARDDPAHAEAATRELAEAGFHVTVVAGEALRDVPPQAEVISFSFSEAGLVAILEGGEVTLTYDLPIIAVLCVPRQAAETDVTRPPSAFLDIYASLDGSLSRISVIQNVTDFSGLGHPTPPSAAGRLMKCAAECEARFTRGQVDRRLVHMQLRRRTLVSVMTPPSGQLRKGFSYATEALTSLLGSISPALKDLSHVELSSRLAYLTRR